MMLTYDEAKAKVDRSRSGEPLLKGRNTRLRKLESYMADGYAVRLHWTDVVVIHPDGTCTLNTGGWDTVTTKDRINEYSPARVGSIGGELCVWHKDDPLTPPKVRKCRVCHGTGKVMSEGYTQTWGWDENGDYTRLQTPVVVPPEERDCYRCSGAGQRDYGSKRRPVIFYDGIIVDSAGKVLDKNAARMYPTEEEVAAKAEAEAKREAARQRAMRRTHAAERIAFMERYGLTPDNGKVQMFKAVDENYFSGYGTEYPVGTKVTCNDFEPHAGCGNGLHFWPTLDMAIEWEHRGRYLVCEIAVKDMIIVGGNKVKVPSCKVLYEVDHEGERKWLPS